MSEEPMLKVGKERVPTPVSKMTDRDLEWYATECRNQEHAALAQSEINRRANGGQTSLPGTGGNAQGAPERQQKPKSDPKAAARPPANQQAITRAAPTQVVAFEGSFSNAARATEALHAASAKCYLVSPAPVCGNLPEGCEMGLSMVSVDGYGPEVYALTGNRDRPADTDTVGLDKNSLNKIGAAAGVTWIVSRRTDDGTDPRYCAWEAIGRVRMFDGQVRDLPGNVEIDARDGSPLIEEIREKAAKRESGRDYRGKKDGGASQILELRKFIQRHAESKAMNRAIANMGVRRSYKRGELKKPFAVARIMFTGRSEDPEVRREFRQMIGQAFMGGTHVLYGGQQPAPGQSPVAALPDAPVPAAPQLKAPPPVGSVPVDDDAIPTEGEDADDVPPDDLSGGGLY